MEAFVLHRGNYCIFRLLDAPYNKLNNTVYIAKFVEKSIRKSHRTTTCTYRT